MCVFIKLYTHKIYCDYGVGIMFIMSGVRGAVLFSSTSIVSRRHWTLNTDQCPLGIGGMPTYYEHNFKLYRIVFTQRETNV